VSIEEQGMTEAAAVTSELEKRLVISIDGEEVNREVQKRVTQLSRTQKINGFRPGKVPFSVAQKRWGEPVKAEVIEELKRKEYFDAISKEDYTPAGYPFFEEREGEKLSFEAVFEVFPTVEVKDIESIEIERPVAKVTEEDIKDMIEGLQKSRADYEEVERACAEGDQVTINFKGMLDGEEFEGGAAEDFNLEIGSGRMIPGFETGIVGMSKGEEKNIDVKFPEDYQADNLAGKDAQFEIKVSKVSEAKLPELTDEFAKGFGVEGGVDALKADIEENMTRELAQNIAQQLKQVVFDQLLDKNPIPVPKAAVHQEVHVMKDEAKQRFAQQRQISPEQVPDLPDSIFEAEASKRVALGLLIASIVKANDIKADETKVDAIIAAQAGGYDNPQEVIDWYKSDKNRLSQIEGLAIEDQVVELILDKAKVTDVEKKFNEIVQR
jgi:trigger factor